MSADMGCHPMARPIVLSMGHLTSQMSHGFSLAAGRNQ
jgi:hypothetical protein